MRRRCSRWRSSGSKIGGGKTVPLVMTVLGASAGCNVGSRVEDGTYGQPTEEVVVVNQPSYPPQYGGGYGVGVVCATYRAGNGSMRPGRVITPTTVERSATKLCKGRQREGRGINTLNPLYITSKEGPPSVRRAIYSQEESRGGMWDRPETKSCWSGCSKKVSPFNGRQLPATWCGQFPMPDR